LEALWKSYGGVCAYLSIYLEEGVATKTVDHYKSKSKEPFKAYEWDNYRLAELSINRDKGEEVVLDPFTLKENTFYLYFSIGEIYPNPSLNSTDRQSAIKTIKYLKLNNPKRCNMRYNRWRKYREMIEAGISDEAAKLLEHHFREEAPFVHYEAQRQGLL
jgi:hypothetical protein